MGQHLRVLFIEVDPDLHSVEGLHVLWGDEAEAVDVLREIEVLSQQIKDKIGVDFILVGLLLAHGEDEASSILIAGILPLGLDALLEVLDRVDPAPFVLDEVAAWGRGYLFCLLLFWRRKWSRLLRW